MVCRVRLEGVVAPRMSPGLKAGMSGLQRKGDLGFPKETFKILLFLFLIHDVSRQLVREIIKVFFSVMYGVSGQFAHTSN